MAQDIPCPEGWDRIDIETALARRSHTLTCDEQGETRVPWDRGQVVIASRRVARLRTANTHRSTNDAIRRSAPAFPDIGTNWSATPCVTGSRKMNLTAFGFGVSWMSLIFGMLLWR